MASLEDVRERIRALDARLVETVAARIEAAREAGRAKRDQHRPIRDYDVEREVVERIREGFAAEDLDPALGERMARLLIAEALRIQEREGLDPGSGRQGSALVIGGAGKMGAWFAHFMNGLGYDVTIQDPAGPLEGFEATQDPVAAATKSDVVIVSTPPDQAARVLEQVAPTDALVFDIASLKTPLNETLTKLAKEHQVTSVHPLWGPDTRVLSGKNVVVLDCGNEAAADAARELFNQTAATVVRLPLHVHDRLMSLTLGLPHALNLAYAEVLSTSGHAYSELKLLGGPTFLKQNAVAAEVTSEDPDLYRQIQALNDESDRLYQALHRAIEALGERVHDRDAFRDAMLNYRDYLEEARDVYPS